jgi:4-amino-4-deoxy-L-arabinose transferase-like glycosyltransferase
MRNHGRGPLLATALIILICLFGHLGAIGLVGPDEPRYASIARAMAATGDWVTPRLYGQPWFEKPILYYWAGAVGFRLHLPDEWAARLPSAFAALAAAIAVGWLGWKHYGHDGDPAANPVLMAPLLFSTSVGAIGFARAAGPDMLFAASLTLAMATGASVLLPSRTLRNMDRSSPGDARSGSAIVVLFGMSVGLAVLAKGPAGIILAGGAIGIWAIATQQWKAAVRLAHPVAIASFCIVALPWYVLCALRNPGFTRVFLVEHNFQRYLTPVFQHRQPFWFFAPILLLALFPWTALLFPAAMEALRLRREKSWSNSPGLFFACWTFFPLLFFSVSQSKLPGYILPAVPAAALLVGISLSRGMRAASASGRWGLAAVGATWIVVGATARWTVRLPGDAVDDLQNAFFYCSIIAIAAGCMITALAFIRMRAALGCSLFLILFFVEIASLRLLPALDPYISARHHGETLRNDRHLDRLFTFELQRSWSYGLAFYLNRQIPEWSPSDPEGALVLTTPAGFEQLKRLGRFHGTLEEEYVGVLYVPVAPAPH